jgi:hypothetical protein
LGKLISLREYAIIHGKSKVTIVKKATAGGFKTAQKVGNTYVIDADEPYIDNRVKSGKYVNWRKKAKSE